MFTEYVNSWYFVTLLLVLRQCWKHTMCLYHRWGLGRSFQSDLVGHLLMSDKVADRYSSVDKCGVKNRKDGAWIWWFKSVTGKRGLLWTMGGTTGWWVGPFSRHFNLCSSGFLALHCSVLRRLLGGREGGTIPPDSIVGSRSGGERSKGGMHCIYTLMIHWFSVS